MVKTLRFHCRGHGFHPCQGPKILHAARRGQRKRKKEKKKNQLASFGSVEAPSALQPAVPLPGTIALPPSLLSSYVPIAAAWNGPGVSLQGDG